MASSKSNFGTDLAANGTSNLCGIRPGPKAFSYEGLMFENFTAWETSYITTHEAIKKFLPPPLEPILDLPPIVQLHAQNNANNRGFDGRNWGYTAVTFHTYAQYKGKRARAHLVEYVDGVHGDKAGSGDMLIAWGIWVGMLKKLADIRFIPSGDELVVTVDRQGTRLVTLDFRIKEELPVANVQGAFRPIGGFKTEFGVREIPTADYKGYAEHSVIEFGGKVAPVKPKKMFSAEVSIELGHTELDPLNLLKVVEQGPAFVTMSDRFKELFSQYELLEQLKSPSGTRRVRQ